MLKKFRKNDIYINRVKAYPKVEFFVNSGSVESVYYNRVSENRTSRKDGHAHLNDIVGGFFEGQIFNFSYDAQQGVVGTSASIAPNNSFGWTDFAFESTPPPGLGIVPSTGLITGTFSPESLMTGSGASTGIDTITISALGPETAFTASFQLTVIGTDLPLPDMYASFDDEMFLSGGNMITLGAYPQEFTLVASEALSVTGNVGEARDFTNTSTISYQLDPCPVEFRTTGSTTVAWTQSFTRTAGHNQTLLAIGAVGESVATNFLQFNAIKTNERVGAEHESGNDGTDRATESNSQVRQDGIYENIVVTRDFDALEYEFYFDGLTDGAKSYVANPNGGSAAEMRIGVSPASSTPYENIADELAYWATTKLDQYEAATVGWLAAKQNSLASWIRGDPPNAPAYSDQGPFDEGVAITPFTPDTPSVDPEAETVTYYEYDELPAGLSLNSSNGEISGTPTTAGTYNIRVAASDGMHLVVSNTFEIEVVV
jgi:hypothetical protein